MPKLITDYEEARLQFRTAALSMKSKYKIESWSFDVVDGLTMDSMIFKPERKEKLLVITTGLHGIEGYVGNFCLQAFLESILHNIDLASTMVVLVHGINPYGMKHYRKVNEDNIDLNRNFLDHATDVVKNEGYQKYKKLFALGRLDKDINILKANFYYEVFKSILKTPPKEMQKSVLIGQYDDPQGFYYGGKQHAESTKLLMKLVNGLIEIPFEKRVFIDIHTGYGPKNMMSILNDDIETRPTSYFKEKFNYPHVYTSADGEFYKTKGDFTRYLSERIGVNDYATVFEFGTLGSSLYNSLRSLRYMVFENNAHQNHHEDEQVYKVSKKHFKTFFMPDDEFWLKQAENNFIKATNGILGHYGMLKE